MDRLTDFMRRHADGVAVAAVFLITLCFFLPGLDFDVIPLDNDSYVGREYLLFPTWKNFIHHLKTPVLGLYSPLVMHSLMLDYALWGKELLQIGGRLHNILLHGLNAVMFYCLLRKLKLVRMDPEHPFTLSIQAALFGTLCFSLHPQRVESVIWLVERKDVLALFFGLLSTLFFIRSFRRGRLPLAGSLFFFISFGAKPMMISLPAVLLAGIWVCTEKFDWRTALKMIFPYLAAAAVYIAVGRGDVGNFIGGSASGVLSIDRLEIAALNYSGYFFRTLLPVGIRPLYPPWRFDAGEIVLCAAFWLMAASSAVLAFRRWRFRRLFSCFIVPLLLAFGAALLPMAGLRDIGNAEFADRYSYYPSLFIWTAAAAGYGYFSLKGFLCKFIFVNYGLLIAVLGICYLYTWRTEESFINAAVGDGVNVHHAAMRMAAWSSFEKGDFDLALTFARNAGRGVRDENTLRELELFQTALEGMIELLMHKQSGLSKLDKVLTTPEWGRFRGGSQGFSETVMLTAASEHLARNTEKDQAFAAEIFMVLGYLTNGADPAKELNYRAISAMLKKDYPQAEALTQEALKYSPGDANLLNNLRAIREKAAAE